MKLLALLGAGLLAASGFTQARTSTGGGLQEPGPRNVILIIGDGMDEQQVTIARNYLKGARGELLLDTMPLRGAAQILTIEDAVDGLPEYVADSANTATSMATGAITSRGRIATSAGSDRPLTSIVELASAAGYRTGLVTTASVTDATPASFAAHINFRRCESPESMVDVTYKDVLIGDCSQYLRSNRGPGSISEQLAESSVDVILGGGAKHFRPEAEGMDITVAELARRNGFHLVATPQELADAPTGGRLLGLFAENTMPVRLRGEDGRSAEHADPSLMNRLHDYMGDVELPEVMTCEPNPDFVGQPTLQEMTDAALARLSRGNDRGFFLMIESASIDKQAHRRNPCGSIGEVEQLDEALASALDFAGDHPRTLVLVTADHSQAAQLTPDEGRGLFAAFPIPQYSPGRIARIATPEGSTMVVNYATTNFMMEEHTGAAVPLYSNNEGHGRVPPYLRQPELFTIMGNYLGL